MPRSDSNRPSSTSAPIGRGCCAPAEGLGEPIGGAGSAAPRVPGSLAAHYAPGTPIELVHAGELADRVASLRKGGLRLAVWSREPCLANSVDWLAAPSDPQEYG